VNIYLKTCLAQLRSLSNQEGWKNVVHISLEFPTKSILRQWLTTFTNKKSWLHQLIALKVKWEEEPDWRFISASGNRPWVIISLKGDNTGQRTTWVVSIKHSVHFENRLSNTRANAVIWGLRLSEAPTYDPILLIFYCKVRVCCIQSTGV